MAKTTINLPGIVPGTQGNLIIAGASGIQTSLAIGANKAYLRSNGAGANPSWQPLPATAYVEYATNTAIGDVIPLDDTAPLITEGLEILTTSFTLSLATSRVRVMFTAFGGLTNAASAIIVALFRDNTCIQAASSDTDAAGETKNLAMMIEDSPGSVGPFTYSIRVGVNSNQMRLNGSSSARYFGGSAKAVMSLQEVFV